MNPNNPDKERDHFLENEFLKYNVKEPQLNFNNSQYRNPEHPDLDPALMSLSPYSGPWEDTQITHLIRRLKFGVTKADIDFFRKLSMADAVDLLLTEATEPPLPVNDYNEDGFTDPDVPFGQTWINAPYRNEFEGGRLMSLKRWWMDNMINQGHSITEKMLLFWHNHLVTEWFGIFVSKASYQYMKTLRKHQMGNFRTLMKDITIDMSMLLYLNGAQSHKDSPDENYARELQELFCVGKGPNSKYTESDVRAAARVLTGWSVDTWPPNKSEFQTWRHDTGDKQFSEFYGNYLIKGRTGTAGQFEVDELLDMIFNNEETALYLCRKIYSFFVYPQISEEVENTIIAPLAQLLRESNFVIKPVLDKLFKSEHFYDINLKAAVIKDPANHLIGVWKALNPPLPPGMNEMEKVELKSSIFWSMHNNGMQLGDPPSVAGWPAYYQQPIFDKGWITTNTILDRAIHTDSLIYWGFWSPSYQVPADLIRFAEQLDNPEDPNQLLNQCILIFLGLDVSDEVKQRLKSILLSNQAEDYYWTTAWIAFKQDPNNDTKRLIVENRLKWTFQRMLQMAETHLM